MAEIGRPKEWGDEIVKKLEEVFAMDGTVSEACFYAGISRQLYYTYVKEDAPAGSSERDLYDRFEALREKPVLKARQTIMKSLDIPETAKWYLERKKKSEFANRTELTGKDGKELKITFDNSFNEATQETTGSSTL